MNCFGSFPRDDIHVTIVMTRFMEPWDRISEFVTLAKAKMCQTTGNLFKKQNVKWDVIVYNRGIDNCPTEYNERFPQVTVIKSKNVGRETYVVHHYIASHYNDLPDIVFFLPAHWWGSLRESYVNQIFRDIYNKPFCPKSSPVPWKTEQHFTLDNWAGSPVNQEGVQNQTYSLAKIRPFGKWFNSRIPVPYKGAITFAGTFSCHRKNIMRYSREQYRDWLAEIEEGGPNAEIGHFWERSFYSLFS